MKPPSKHTHDTVKMDRVELAELIKKSSIPPAPPAPPAPAPYIPTEWNLAKVIIDDDDGEID